MSTVCVDDADLVERARGGDQAAFGQLVDRHRTAVYRAAMAILRSHADAEDASQDAFVSAFKHLNRFRGDSSFKTWLLTIAWRQAINRRRSLSAIWRYIASGDRGVWSTESGRDVLDEAAAADRSPEQLMTDDQLRRHITAAIDALTPKLRDVLLLAQSGEYTYEEIGAVVGAPVGTIKWRVSEARRAVKAHLRRCGYADVG